MTSSTIDYKVISNRNNTSYIFSGKENIELNKQTLLNKLFNDDLIDYDKESNTINIKYSPVRVCQYIPGVLVLKNNKTYGRVSVKGKLLYKCVPNDNKLPCFLIPYEMKHIGFSKVFINIYITFQFKEWNVNDNYPLGIITQNIGSVDILNNFYEYQLYCKSLNFSIQKFNKDVIKYSHLKSDSEILKKEIFEKYPSIEDRTNQSIYKIFSIDPMGCSDFDDAFSISRLGENKYKISIYISNVPLWIDFLELWESFSSRVSTIYLPDKKRSMMPSILSDCLCSLQENQNRLAFVMDTIFYLDVNKKLQIENISYSNVLINIYKNYSYEESTILLDENYILLFETTKNISMQYKYLSIKNSHDLVAYLMVFMNHYTAKEMQKNNTGIFRSVQIKEQEGEKEDDVVPEDIEDFIKIWNSSSGNYVEIKEGVNISHELLKMDAYIHITSPIRRIVDLLNIIKFQENKFGILSQNANTFYNKWVTELDFINLSMKSIRKIQNECSLLHLCCTDAEVMKEIYIGYVFDKLERNDGLIQYMVVIPKLKMISKIITRENNKNYSQYEFKLYLFSNEENFKKKIRLEQI
jgi:exoribonuclease R